MLRTPQLSLGPKLVEFEQAFARYIGVPHGVALSSGTAGLHLGLQALGIGEGDEVIVPSFTFIAAANAILYVGAAPVFADIDPLTLNLTRESIERVLSPRTRAILLVHTFGYPADLDPILDLCRRHNLRLIEDACEAIGAEYRGRKIGAFGDLAVFSFYPNKPITTGEGGVLVTPHPELARTISALRNQGRFDTDGWLDHSVLGYNYRLPEISCALGISQLARVESILARREAVGNLYCESLRAYAEIELPQQSAPQGRLSWFALIVRVPGYRDRIIQALTEARIGCRSYFPPIHRQPLYASYAPTAGSLPVTEDIAARTLALPFFNAITPDEIARVCLVLGEATRRP